jgi:hypothetical protein
MRMLSTIDEKKWLVIERKALKWVKANNAPGRWDDYDIAFMTMIIIEQKKLECIECTNKGDELYDVSTCCTKFLKYNLNNWKCLPHLVE